MHDVQYTHCRTSSDSKVTSHQQGLVSNRPALDDVLEPPEAERTVLVEPHKPLSHDRPAGKPPPKGTEPDFIAPAFHDLFRAGRSSVADGYVPQTDRSYQGNCLALLVRHSEVAGGTAVPRPGHHGKTEAILPCEEETADDGADGLVPLKVTLARGAGARLPLYRAVIEEIDAALEPAAAVLARGAAFSGRGDRVGAERPGTPHQAAVNLFSLPRGLYRLPEVGGEEEEEEGCGDG